MRCGLLWSDRGRHVSNSYRHPSELRLRGRHYSVQRNNDGSPAHNGGFRSRGGLAGVSWTGWSISSRRTRRRNPDRARSPRSLRRTGRWHAHYLTRSRPMWRKAASMRFSHIACAAAISRPPTIARFDCQTFMAASRAGPSRSQKLSNMADAAKVKRTKPRAAGATNRPRISSSPATN